MIGNWVADWNRHRPPHRSGFGRREAEFVAAVDWLADAAGMTREGVENIMKGRTSTTELRIADALLSAIDRADALAEFDGRPADLPIQQNPRARACCGGSLTGDARRR